MSEDYVDAWHDRWRLHPDFGWIVTSLKKLDQGLQIAILNELMGFRDLAKAYGKRNRASGCSGVWRYCVGQRPREFDQAYMLPGDDHCELRRDSKGVYRYFSHPYWVPPKAELDAAAEKYGLEYEVRSESWYYPGHTFLIVWAGKGKGTRPPS
jgi:hypothetical protein